MGRKEKGKGRKGREEEGRGPYRSNSASTTTWSARGSGYDCDVTWRADVTQQWRLIMTACQHDNL